MAASQSFEWNDVGSAHAQRTSGAFSGPTFSSSSSASPPPLRRRRRPPQPPGPATRRCRWGVHSALKVGYLVSPRQHTICDLVMNEKGPLKSMSTKSGPQRRSPIWNTIQLGPWFPFPQQLSKSFRMANFLLESFDEDVQRTNDRANLFKPRDPPLA